MGKPRLTLDASAKVKASAVTHLKNHLAHIYRDAIERDGERVHHSQEVRESLDARRTSWNISAVGKYDPKSGQYKFYRMEKRESVEYIEKRVHEKLEELDRDVRHDNVILRPIIVAMGEEYYPEGWQDFKEGTPEHEAFIKQVEKVNSDMLTFLAKKLGRENILGFSIHLDEATVQTQVTFMPQYVSEKTSKTLLSQNHFFGKGRNGKELRALHKDFRAYMASKGYDIELKSSARSTESLKGKKYGEKRDLERLQAEIDLKTREDAFNEKVEAYEAQENERTAELAQLDQDIFKLKKQKAQLEEQMSYYTEGLSLFEQLEERNVPRPYWLDIIHRAHDLAEFEERGKVGEINKYRNVADAVAERTRFTPSQVSRHLDRAVELWKADPGYRIVPNSSADLRRRDYGEVETLDGVQVAGHDSGLSYGR